MTSLHSLVRILVIALLPTSTAWSQSAQVPAPPQDGSIIIVNARIHPVSDEHPAPIESGWIRFNEGRIVGLGEGAPQLASDESEIIDAGGLTVVPGFISGPSQIGLLEVKQVDATDDRREGASRSPEVAPWLAVNPDSDLIPVARAAGILHTFAVPIGGTIPGRTSVLRMDGWTTEDLAVVRDAGVMVSWPTMTPITASWMRRSRDEQARSIEKRVREIDQWFDDAEAWNRAKDVDSTIRTDLRFAAVEPVIRGERPVFIRADSRGQIESAIAWATARGYRPVVVGGSNAADCIDVLQTTATPVILTRVHRLPSSRHHSVDRTLTLPAILEEAGIPFAIGFEDEPAHERGLAHNAATAVAHGLSQDAALRSITRGPAEILGVGDRIGSLTPGRSATFFICDGDPLEMNAIPLRAWIDGREIDLGSRQRRMLEKYREKYRRTGQIEAATP